MTGASSIKFKVRCVLQTGLRSVVIAEHPEGETFEFKPGDLLNGIAVKEIGIPRKTDKDDKQMFNCRSFTLENELDSVHFKEGDVVEITNIAKEIYNKAPKMDVDNNSAS
ncbi:hypothetical protein [Pleionea litopenaei]|uniref:Uncharacterized protein n=1 Tax=Pleionea litopenaei TaxID=3070815 RepID=A0AA51RVT5_9GAMM|nr:hypothetical protein [Pleionea sp. HL-JVS1]WMS88378.1 hypothetical protein Q9312_05550 [Pleionea sp. HL-JVS1]